MTTSEIIKLLDAGYTKDEITAMDNQEQPEQPEAEQPEAEQPEPAPEHDSVNADVSALKDELSSTRQQLDQLVKQMQSNNLKTASINILPEADLDKKTDEAMAELIRPSYERREN